MAFVSAQLQPTMMTLQRNLDACQFGGVARPSTRDAIALADEVLRRFGERRKCLELGRRNAKTALPCLAMVFFDLSKAFDLDRSSAWWAVAQLAGDASPEFLLERLHRGVCYILKDKHAGHQLKRILTSKGLRQGSVEGLA